MSVYMFVRTHVCFYLYIYLDQKKITEILLIKTFFFIFAYLSFSCVGPCIS